MIFSENQLLIKVDAENMFKNIKKNTKELYIQNEPVKLNSNILLDYYNLITNNITDINTTIYILHLISREINKSDIIEQKALLSLLPEFFVPFFNNDISLTYPYINRILTTIQSNIQCNISSIYIGEIFKKIIFYLFFDEEENIKEPINKKHFEICQGFCLYNMKLKSNKNQEVGIICLNILLNELDYSFLNQNNFVYYIWENITYFLDEPNFFPKNYLLKYLSDFISKFKIQFKPYVEITIYKILEYIDDKDGNIRKSSLNILGLLISFYPKEIDLIKNLIMQLLLILNRDKDENIRIKSIYIYNKLKKQYDLYNPIKTKKKNKTNLYFYDSGNNKHFNQKTQNLNITGNESIVLHRRVLSINSCHSNINVFNKGYKKKTLYTEPRSSKSDIGENSPIIIKQSKEKEDLKNNENKIKVNRYLNKDIDFRKLLKMVKNQKDDKIKSDFSDIRNVVKKNNNGLLRIKKLKSKKDI